MKWFTIKERVPRRCKIFVYLTNEGLFKLGIYPLEDDGYWQKVDGIDCLFNPKYPPTAYQIFLWAYIQFPKKRIHKQAQFLYYSTPHKSESVSAPYILSKKQMKDLQNGNSWIKKYKYLLENQKIRISEDNKK